MRKMVIVLAVAALAAWPCAWDTDPQDIANMSLFPTASTSTGIGR
ncbi:hypothetical protein [uncultured Thalassospira sp.]|jgi:hypothetical protein|tara:strand:+ start:6382 stop:6516 length:135 start_codon:yes stop_codon:yes gene_type:complete